MQHIRFLLVLVVVGLTGCNHDGGVSVGLPPEALPVEPLESGLQTLMSGGVEREFFLALTGEAGMAGTASGGAGMSQVAAADDGMSQVAAHDGDDADRPIIFALHGYTSSYTVWVGETRSNDLIDVIGDHAVFVAPQALPDAQGLAQWGGQADLDFFIDMIVEFERRGLEFDRNKIFVVGHSNGGGFANRLGCAHGDIFRALVAAAGSLIDTDCIGSLAVMLFHGENDPIGDIGLAESTRQYWVLYNGWDPDAFVRAFEDRCDDYSFPDQPDNLPYPVVFCLHQQGHDIPDFGSEVMWDFLTSLPEVERTDESPPGGGAEVATPPSDTTLTFQVDVPAEMPRALAMALTLRPLSQLENPTCSRPDVILTTKLAAEGALIPGQLSEPITIPITYREEEVFPSEWALNVNIFVEGGSTANTPTPFIDYRAATPVSLVSRTAPVVVSEVLTPEPGPNPCNFDL